MYWSRTPDGACATKASHSSFFSLSSVLWHVFFLFSPRHVPLPLFLQLSFALRSCSASCHDKLPLALPAPPQGFLILARPTPTASLPLALALSLSLLGGESCCGKFPACLPLHGRLVSQHRCWGSNRDRVPDSCTKLLLPRKKINPQK